MALRIESNDFAKQVHTEKERQELEKQLRSNKVTKFEKKLLLKKISEMENLPTPSAHIMKIMLLLRDENVKMGELNSTIERDQSLVAQILKLINSGYYGLRKTIDNVEQAVALLGILNIKQVIYSASIMDMFDKDEQTEWEHSYSCSVLMTKIMHQHDIPAASNLPLTMLLHDIGKVVLRRFSKTKYLMAKNYATEYDVALHDAEDIIIHINHAEISNFLMTQWEMTDDIIIPIKAHHDVEPPKEYVLETAMVQIVNYIDNTARGVVIPPPSALLLHEAGIEEFDMEYWTDYQANLIAELNGDEPPTKENSTAGLAAPSSHIGDKEDDFSDTGTAKIDVSDIVSSKVENVESSTVSTDTQKINI
jgi:HD-like signal output (HDOD) protein